MSPPTSAADISALDALMESHRRGIKVPHQISLLGFGDFDIGVTSMRQRTSAFGSPGAHALNGIEPSVPVVSTTKA